MAVTLYRYIFWVFFLTINESAYGQVKKDTSFTFDYEDAYGNTISIKDFRKLPSILDTTFLKANLNSAHFSRGISSKTLFHYRVDEISVVKKDKVFELRLSKHPMTNDVIELVKNNGYTHYRLYLRKRKTGIERVEFLYTEI